MLKRLIFAITVLSVTGLFSGCFAVNSSNLASSTSAGKVISTHTKVVASSSKSKTVTKTKAEFDSERPEQTVLKAIDKGEDVIRIQNRLRIYGYNVVADGDYGNGTTYAVMDFQQKHNFEPSGIVSGATLDALYQVPTQGNVYKPATQSLLTAEEVDSKATYESTLNSADNTSSTNNYILVNLSQQRVYIFYGTDHNWKLINTFSCGSGTAATPTVMGHFCVGVKGLYFKSGTSVYCKYFSQISGNYLFHSILYDKNGNVLDGNLGAVESHGCIRLALENAKYIYDNIPIGSEIWIK